MNIYQIKQDFLSIFEELEENGGELTEELSNKLAITKENYCDKIESYVNVVKNFEDELSIIKAEQARLKALSEKKTRALDKTKKIIISSIKEFGDTKKTGVKYVNYITGEASVRKLPVVEVNTDLVDIVGENIDITLANGVINNQLDTQDKFDITEFINYLKDKYSFEDSNITENDLKNIDLEVTMVVSIDDIIKGNGYKALKEIYKDASCRNMKASVCKTDLKYKLKENGSCCPNLARLNINESLFIK